MKLDDALLGHIVVKMQLQEAIKNGVKVKISDLASSETCVAGKWLNGEGLALYGEFKNFRRLFDAHVEFHTVAAMIVDRMDAGDFAEAGRLAGKYGEFMGTSINLMSAVSRLQTEISQARKDE